jgi:glyoxylase-like metal-dependent hydrolase (beta-lactamase superfamily II)
MDAALIHHPKGDLLIDTGFGRDVDSHVTTTPWLMRTLAKYQLTAAVADQLKAADYRSAQLKGIILTHAHWDHVSGLPDLDGTPVLINAAERKFIDQGSEHTALARSFSDTVNYQLYDFSDGAYMGYAKSLDVYKDGSIVLVPMSGHTPGSTGIFVTLPSGKRFFFIGDLVWLKEGYERPAERPFLSRDLVGEDGAAVRKEIVHVHRLHNKFPELTIVPAHDRRQFAGIAGFPEATP